MSEPENVSNYWGSWLAVAQSQAKDFVDKAQEIAELASKATQEQASYLAKQASELRQKYDTEVATSILMSTVGGPIDTAHTKQQENEKPTKLNFKELDLVYVTENLIAMAFPYDRSKSGHSDTGNDINVVAAFLRKKHKDHFMIWNVSEESYDYSLFADQVLEYKFPGHPAPPLGLLFKICTSVESWLDADERNIAVCHCLTGKGRTAALMACVLAWIGEFSSPMEALQYIAERRSTTVDFLTIPSQRRYVQYFSNMLDGVKPRSEPLLLRRVIINSIPVFGTGPGGETAHQGCCPYLQLFKNGRLIATATPQVEGGTSSAASADDASGKSDKLQLRWINASEGSASFAVDCAIQGDILLRCRHAAVSGTRVSMFRAGFHTGYVPSGVLRLTKAQLDGSSSDPRYDDNFFIDLIFAPIVKATNASSTGDGVNASSSIPASDPLGASQVTDSGLTIDATSTDKYELSLHKDARFWETISTRKTRSRRRRSRKFVSSQQEQFSIGEDPRSAGLQDDDVEVSFMGAMAGSAAAAGGTNASSVSGLSDMDLIMQLAQLEDGGDIMSQTSSVCEQGADSDDFTLIGRKPVGTDSASQELQSLEELERELGLGDMQLFGGVKKSTTAQPVVNQSQAAAAVISTPVSVTPAKKVVDDDDNLDELEQYLQSLSSTPAAT